MLCKNPYMRENIPHGCGQCLPCRLNKRREWTHRIMLESMCHPTSTFVTLTYSPENIPAGFTLRPEDTRNWIKRLRKKLGDKKIRYYLVGEYGSETERPHYHAALFGYDICEYGRPFIRKNKGCPCDPCKILENTWGLGNTYNGTLTKDSAQYIAGYVTKKMTKKDDPRLLGRHPEYARMSNRPGIGADFTDNIIRSLESEHGVKVIEENQDVPTTLRHGKKDLPLGRYLKRKLRENMGWKETGTPEEVLSQLRQERIEEYKELFVEAKKENTFTNKTQKDLLLEKNKQKVLNLEKRTKIYTKTKTI